MSKKRPSVPPSPLDEEVIMFPNGYEPPEKRLKKKRLQTENPDNSIFLSQHADIPTSNHADMERRQVADIPPSQHSGVEAGLHDSKELSQHPSITPSLQDSTESSQHGGKALSLYNSMESSQHGSKEPSLHDSKELSQQGSMAPSLQDSKEASQYSDKELSPGGKEPLQQATSLHENTTPLALPDSGASNSAPARPSFFAPPEKTQQDMPPERKSASQCDDITVEQHRPEIPSHTDTLSIYQDRNEEPVLHSYKSTTQGDLDTATNLPKATFYLRPGLKEYLNTMALYFNTPVYKLVIEAIDKFIEQLPPEDRKTIDLIHNATQKKRKPHS